MAASDARRSGLAAMLDRLADLETRQQDLDFDALREKVLAGDTDGWTRFVEKYSRFVYTVTLRLLSGLPDREEAAAVIYTRTFERLTARNHRLLREFGGRCRFTTYLYRIVQSERKEHFKKARLQESEALDERVGDPVDPQEAPAPALQPERLAEAVRRALAGLAPRQRVLLLCRFRDGLKLREIADFFGLADTNAAAREVYAALEHLEPLKTLDDRERLGAAEREELRRALRDQLFRLRGASRGEA